MTKKDKDDNIAEKNMGEKIIDTAQNVNTANDINQDVVNNEQDAKISNARVPTSKISVAKLIRSVKVMLILPVLRLSKRSCRYLTILIALLLLTPIRLVLLLKT